MCDDKCLASRSPSTIILFSGWCKLIVSVGKRIFHEKCNGGNYKSLRYMELEIFEMLLRVSVNGWSATKMMSSFSGSGV